MFSHDYFLPMTMIANTILSRRLRAMSMYDFRVNDEICEPTRATNKSWWKKLEILALSLFEKAWPEQGRRERPEVILRFRTFEQVPLDPPLVNGEVGWPQE
jgi:hypothetical protein